MNDLVFRTLGFGEDAVDYLRAWDLQRDLHAQVADGAPDTVLLLEHPPVYTAGKRTEPHERPFDGTPVIDVDRGGKITWHGPGQLVGYPIVRLPDPVDVVALRPPARGGADRASAPTSASPTARVDGPQRRLGAPPTSRRTRTASRRDRHPGRRGRDHARLRAQLRPRPRPGSTGSCRAASPTPA